MFDPIQSRADVVFFSLGAVVGLLIAWRPRQVIRFISWGRPVPGWIVRFDQAMGALVAVCALSLLALHFFAK